MTSPTRATRLPSASRPRPLRTRARPIESASDPAPTRRPRGAGRGDRRHALPIGPFRDALVGVSPGHNHSPLRRLRRAARLLPALGQPDRSPAAAPVRVYRRVELRADAICTGLQLVNFWQDIALDWAKGRVYLPADDMRFGVSERQIGDGVADERWRRLMAFEVRGRASCCAPDCRSRRRCRCARGSSSRWWSPAACASCGQSTSPRETSSGAPCSSVCAGGTGR